MDKHGKDGKPTGSWNGDERRRGPSDEYKGDDRRRAEAANDSSGGKPPIGDSDEGEHSGY